MTREEIELTIDYLKNIQKEYTIVGENDGYTYPLPEWYALNNAIEALEQKPYEKFKSVKDHIYKLAGDYKCWDNRLTQDEALELCHILEQEPCTLDDAREDFVFDVYNILDFLPTNDEANRIIEVFDRVTSDIRQEPILDKITNDIQTLRGCSCWCSDGIIDDVEDIIDKYKAESEDKE